MLRSYILITIRNLFKHRLFSLINISGLSIGIASCIFIFLYVGNELSYDRFHKNEDAIYRITTLLKNNDKQDAIATTPSPLAQTLLKDFPFIKNATRIGKWQATFTQNSHVFEEKNIYAIDPSFFSLFSFPMSEGDGQKALSQSNSIVITEAAAQRYFGNDWQKKNVTGKTITAKAGANGYVFTVQGIVKNPPSNSTLQFDFLLPFSFLQTFDGSENQWNYSSYYTYVQTDDNVSAFTLSKAIQQQVLRYEKASGAWLQVQPLHDIYLHSHFASGSDLFITGNLAYVYTLSSIGLIILLLACINFVNLATARAMRRSREVGLRKTIGASRLQLIGQFLLEAGILCGIALVAALLMVQLFFPLFITVSGKNIDFHPSLNNGLSLLLFYVSVVLLSGFYPAFFLSSFRAARAICGALVADSGKRFREAMIFVQFTVSAVMIVCAVVISQQLTFIQEKDLGFNKSQLMYLKLKSPDAKKNYALLQHDILQQANVAGVSAATANLVDVSNGGDIKWQGMKSGDNFSMTQITSDENFLPVTGMTIAQGRNFSNQITSDSASFIINEAASKRMNYGKDAVGKKLSFWNVEGSVIGVVKDFNFQPLTNSVQPLLLRYRPDEWHFTLLIKIKPNETLSTLKTVKELYKKYDKESAFEYGFVDEALNKLYATQQQEGSLINLFTILSVFISCIGLFGLVSYSVEQRIKEIGIRKVMGADLSDIIRLLSGDFMKLIYLSLLIAAPVSYYFASQWLQDFVYQVNLHWWQFGMIGIFVVALALFMISLQAIHAQLSNPVKSLRTE